MLYRRSFLSAALSLAISVLPAVAQDIPNLVGTWKGTAYAVHIGSNPYRVAQGKGPNFPDNGIEFTYVISEQHGNRFAGEMSAGKFTETIIGALQPDNKGGVMLDDDGKYLISLVDADTMDICYTHQFPTSRVAACWQLKRAQ
jgi:hypothetical protein